MSGEKDIVKGRIKEAAGVLTNDDKLRAKERQTRRLAKSSRLSGRSSTRPRMPPRRPRNRVERSHRIGLATSPRGRRNPCATNFTVGRRSTAPNRAVQTGDTRGTADRVAIDVVDDQRPIDQLAMSRRSQIMLRTHHV